MAVDAQRRNFLRAQPLQRTAPRPPWSVSEAVFTTLCERCTQCSQACPQHIIKTGDGGFPEIDFHTGECTFCARCVQACPSAALQADINQPPWQISLTIASHCLGLNQVFCGICREQCPHAALRLQRLSAGRTQVLIDAARCTGCGACVGPCPVAAVQLTTTAMPAASPADEETSV